MRRALLLLAIAAIVPVVAPAHAKSSNPAFLGIGMEDVGGNRGIGPCMITSVEPGTGADDAGLRSGDLLIKIDGRLVANCDALVAQIQARQPGDEIALDVQRMAFARATLVVKARLSSRDDLLRRKFVGQPAPAVRLLDVDGAPGATVLGTPRRFVTVIGWYPAACDGCDDVFRAVARWARGHTRGAPVQVWSATSGDKRRSLADNLEALRFAARTLDVRLLLTDTQTYEQFTFPDSDRIHFMVIDTRGIVRYVAPIAPGADDAEAMLDELQAAAAQASRR